MAAVKSSLGRVLPRSSMLFLCDMQEKFRHIAYFPEIVSVAARMLKVARLLEVPVVLTEQYPQGLGPTVPELGAKGLQPLPKTCFSMVPVVRHELDARPQLRSVILCGIETQACIMQTALDLLDLGLQVHVVVDACSSRSQVDRLVALARMRQSGVFLSTSEGLILQLVGDAAHPQFREVLALIPHLPRTCKCLLSPHHSFAVYIWERRRRFLQRGLSSHGRHPVNHKSMLGEADGRQWEWKER